MMSGLYHYKYRDTFVDENDDFAPLSKPYDYGFAGGKDKKSLLHHGFIISTHNIAFNEITDALTDQEEEIKINRKQGETYDRFIRQTIKYSFQNQIETGLTPMNKAKKEINTTADFIDLMMEMISQNGKYSCLGYPIYVAKPYEYDKIDTHFRYNIMVGSTQLERFNSLYALMQIMYPLELSQLMLPILVNDFTKNNPPSYCTITDNLVNDINTYITAFWSNDIEAKTRFLESGKKAVKGTDYFPLPTDPASYAIINKLHEDTTLREYVDKNLTSLRAFNQQLCDAIMSLTHNEIFPSQYYEAFHKDKKSAKNDMKYNVRINFPEMRQHLRDTIADTWVDFKEFQNNQRTLMPCKNSRIPAFIKTRIHNQIANGTYDSYDRDRKEVKGSQFSDKMDEFLINEAYFNNLEYMYVDLINKAMGVVLVNEKGKLRRNGSDKDSNVITTVEFDTPTLYKLNHLMKDGDPKMKLYFVTKNYQTLHSTYTFVYQLTAGLL